MVFALGWLASCRPTPHAGAIDPALAACVPQNAVAIAGANLDALRETALSQAIPLIAGYPDSRSLVAAYTGAELLIATSRGPGTQVSLTGPADAVEAARDRHEDSPLLAPAESMAAGGDVWAIVRGDVMLPLSGNAANLNRLMRGMEFAGVAVRTHPDIEFVLSARGRSAESARQFENTLRATLTVTAAAEARQADLAAALRSVQIQREGSEVRASLHASADTARRVIEVLAK